MKNNIIDLSERRAKTGEEKSRLKDLKLRIDVEQAKVLVSTSIISILFLVTLANNNILSQTERGSGDFASISGKVGGRGPDAVMTGTTDVEDAMARRLAQMSLKETSSIGRAPTALEKLTLGYLEGKYAVRMEHGKLRTIEFANAAHIGDLPKLVTDRAQFLDENRGLLPVQFDKSVKVETSKSGKELVEFYDLVNGAGIPVAKAAFQIDESGRLLSMKVESTGLATN